MLLISMTTPPALRTMEHSEYNCHILLRTFVPLQVYPALSDVSFNLLIFLHKGGFSIDQEEGNEELECECDIVEKSPFFHEFLRGQVVEIGEQEDARC
jgi:hypothetical protein